MRLVYDCLLGFVLGFTLSVAAHAEESPRFKLLSSQKMNLDIDRFLENREPMTPDIDMHEYRGRIALHWDVGLINDLVQFRNLIHGEGTDSQFETMGWQFEVGIPVGQVELTYKHHSQHRLDTEQPRGNRTFPVQDSYGLRFCFVGVCK